LTRPRGVTPLNSRARKSKLKTLRARDGDQCWYCETLIDFSLPRTDPEAWTFEHVVPAFKPTATNENENLRLTHQVCNHTRGKFFEREMKRVAA
jgi:5-methylcytosine-specific restriction endonuclease McrA